MSEETNSSTPLPSEEENISDSQAFKMYSDYDVVTVAFKRKAMLRAYAKKTVEKKLHPKQLQSLAPSPAYYVKGGKLNFGNASKGHHMPPKIEDRWWEKQPTIAGEGQNACQSRLSSVDNFTGLYRARFQAGKGYSGHGDYIDNPLKAIRLLQSTSYNNLTIPQRAGDFANEVQWRLMLRG